MREKLIELFFGYQEKYNSLVPSKDGLADHILSDGWIRLPCKVGDTVYRISDDCEFPGDCGTKRMCNGCEYRRLIIEEQTFDLSMLCSNGSLYKGYYLTITEAEAALKDGE